MVCYVSVRSLLLRLLLAAPLAFAPALGWARAGSGYSLGSRGTRTYAAPPASRTAPFGGQPIQRSLTAPGYLPGYPPRAGIGGPGFGYPQRSPFASALLGGLIGAGIGGLLFGRGLFYGIHGGAGLLGLLLQLLLLFLIARWLLRRIVTGGRAAAGSGWMGGPPRRGLGGMPSGARPAPTVPITRTDYQDFDLLLRNIQAAWSAHDLDTLRRMATPEMVGYFAEQLAEQTSRGVRNTVSDVRLLQGDLVEAWSEGPRDYATVAMRYSMIDVTRDASGRVVDGSPNERVTVTELWTFVRSRGGNWILSAIQQPR